MHPPGYHMRIARPTRNLEKTCAMYCRGLGLRVVGEFSDHEGFDGLMLGFEGAQYHFEFTANRAHPVTPSPTMEDLVVLYMPNPDEWQAGCSRMEAAGFLPVAAFNPYWNVNACTFQDSDGYLIVLSNAIWEPQPLPGSPTLP